MSVPSGPPPRLITRLRRWWISPAPSCSLWISAGRRRVGPNGQSVGAIWTFLRALPNHPSAGLAGGAGRPRSGTDADGPCCRRRRFTKADRDDLIADPGPDRRWYRPWSTGSAARRSRGGPDAVPRSATSTVLFSTETVYEDAESRYSNSDGDGSTQTCRPMSWIWPPSPSWATRPVGDPAVTVSMTRSNGCPRRGRTRGWRRATGGRPRFRRRVVRLPGGGGPLSRRPAVILIAPGQP